MIVPDGVDLAKVTHAELVAAYVRDGFTPEEAAVLAALVLDGPDPDDPPVV